MVDKHQGLPECPDIHVTEKHHMSSSVCRETTATDRTWTQDQSDAIYTRGCDILVAAGAGAGKTAVLVERVIQGLLSDEAALDIERLLVVTFTEAAAAEMRQRIRKALEDKLRLEPQNARLQHQLARLPLASISTIHAFCSQQLRRYFYYLGLDPEFRIMDEAEANLLRYEIVDQVLANHYLESDEAVMDFVDAYGGRSGDEEVKKLILRLYAFQMSLPEPQAWQQAVVTSFLHESIESLRTSPLMREAQRQVQLELRQVMSMLEQALQTCYLPNGPASYMECLQNERAAVVELWKLVEDQRWDELRDWSDPFTRLPRISKTMQVDDELKSRCTTLRDAAKDRLRDLAAIFFSRTAAEIIEEMRRLAPTVELIFQLVIEFADAYREVKQMQGALDFADLEQLALKLLTVPIEGGSLAPSAVALELQDRFDEILIDEYQDTNGVQDCILTMVAGVQEREIATTPRFMVGDIKQSIYGFRLTDPGLFLAKYQEFSPEEGARQRRIDLATNFRSREEIIDGVNFIFRQLMTRELAGISYDTRAELRYGGNYPELDLEVVEVAAAGEVPCGSADGEQRRLEFYLLDADAGKQSHGESASDADEDSLGGSDDSDAMEGLFGDGIEELEQLEREAWLIAGRIRQLVGGSPEELREVQADGVTGIPNVVWDKSLNSYRPVQYRDIVVLMRSVKNRANQVMEVFRQAGIPAYADLGSGYFAAIEVKLMVSLLQVLDNPQQDIPLAAVLRAPWVGLSDEELALVRLNAPNGSFYEAVKATAGEPGELGQKLQMTLETLERWRTAARRMTLSQLIWYLYGETGFYDYAGSMPKGEQRLANLRGLHDRAREFDDFAGTGLSRFVWFLEKLQEDDDLGEIRPLGEGENVVRVMSMHKSKGLEFPIVFLADLGKNFNMQDLRQDILLHKDLGLGLNVVDPVKRFRYGSLAHRVVRGRLHEELIAEEMRILYVAMTRARERLILIGSRRNLARACARWISRAFQEGWRLPTDLLISATQYLDWLGPALGRHRDGQVLRHIGGVGEPVQGEATISEDPSSWYIWIEGHSELPSWLQLMVENHGQEAIQWERVRELQPLDTPALTQELRELFSNQLLWKYSEHEAANLPAKISVTELKRWIEPEDGSTHPDVPMAASSAGSFPGRATGHVFRRPRFILAERERVSAVEKGIWTHTVLQNLDLNQDLAEARILKREAQRLVEEGFITGKQLEAVDLDSIRHFFQGVLGRRLLQSPISVRREVPFTLAIPAERVYHNSVTSDSVTIQGVIDCLVDEGEGILLVDFKTDRVSSGRRLQAAASYRLQIDQYCKAVETIFGRKVSEAYLYFLEGRSAVQMR